MLALRAEKAEHYNRMATELIEELAGCIEALAPAPAAEGGHTAS